MTRGCDHLGCPCLLDLRILFIVYAGLQYKRAVAELLLLPLTVLSAWVMRLPRTFSFPNNI